MDRHLLTHPLEITDKSMPARNLKGHERDLPQKPGCGEVFLQTSDMQNPYGVGTVRHRPIQWNAIDEAAVEEVLVTDSHWGKYAWQRAGRKHRLDQFPFVEPVFAGTLDAGRDTLERNGEVLEPLRWQVVAQHSS
jgi:hypothetical protein